MWGCVKILIFFTFYVTCQSFIHRRPRPFNFLKYPAKYRTQSILASSVPAQNVHTLGSDEVWKSLRKDALLEASNEPLLASFMHSSILSHQTLEQALSFHMANLLASPAMISTQIQALFLEAFDKSPSFKDTLRADIQAVKDRDPAVKSFTDVILYFKGFQALQAHRVAHWLWNENRKTIALFLYSRANVVFNLDIHPGAKLGSAILIDHGTGVVIGETSIVGNNVSMLHKVTLGGIGIREGQRHPIIGDGVLLGAGCILLGPVTVGEGSNIGASSMVSENIPAHSTAVGVPAKILSRKPVAVNENPTKAVEVDPGISMDASLLHFDI